MTRLLLAAESSGSLYAVPSEHVREITPLGGLTRIPRAPEYVRGLFNLRGVLLTVIDLSHRLGQPPCQGAEPSILVLQVEGKTLGLLVDDVHEVFSPDDGETAEPADLTAGRPGSLVARMGHFREAIVIEVDVRELVRQTLA
jgi:purine-binding chemotaxis protein CheW